MAAKTVGEVLFSVAARAARTGAKTSEGALFVAVVEDAQIIDDLTKQVGVARQQTSDALELLTLAQHALAEGNLKVVEEFLDRSVTHLRKIPR